MAIALCSPDHEESLQSDAGNTGTFSFTVPSDCTFLIVCVSAYANDANYLSNETDAMRFNDSVNMGKGYITDASTSTWMGQMFYLVNPTTGSVHVDWNFKGTTVPAGVLASLYAIYLKGVDTSSPVRTTGGEQQAGGTQYETGTLSGLQSGDMAIMFAWTYQTSDINLTWNPGTEISDDKNSTINSAIAYHSPSGDTNYIMDNVGDDGGISVLVVDGSGGTAAVTGTATASITEADVVAGNKTIIITLTGDTWIAS